MKAILPMKIKLAILSLLFLFGCGSSGSIDPTGSTPSGTNPPGVTPPVVTPPVVTPPVVTPPVVVNPATILRTAKGEWLAADGGAGGNGVTNVKSMKNMHYTFEVKENNQKIEIGITSADIDIEFNFYDPLGTLKESTANSRNIKKSYTVNAGIYKVIIAATRYAVGKFELTLLGVNDEPKKIVTNILKSNTQNWGKLGGGGLDKTFKNHFYTFEVTDNNQNIDIELESPDTEIALVLYDQLGTQLSFQRSNRREFILRLLNKGTYSVMVATNKRGSIGNYRLNINGLVNNLKKVLSEVDIDSGSWANGKEVFYYEFEITENNSPFDVELSSPDVAVTLELTTKVGTRIESQSAGKTEFIVRDLAKGAYRVYVSPRITTGPGGKYTLTSHGQYK